MEEQAAPPDTSAFPDEVVARAAGVSPCDVLVIGSAALVHALEQVGHRVTHAPGVAPLPVGDHTVDAVVAADRLPADLMDVARVLRTGGHLALVVSDRDHRIPWARKLDAAVGAGPVEEPAADLVASSLFGPVEESTHQAWQTINRDGLLALLPTLPALVDLDTAERDARIAAALDLYDGYGRGADGMQLPWTIRCFHAVVVENAYVPPRPAPAAGTEHAGPEAEDTEPGEPGTGGAGPGGAGPDDPEAGAEGTPTHAGPAWVGEDTQPIGRTPDRADFTFDADEFDDTGMLLIDFR